LIFLLRKKIIFEKIEAYHIGRKGKHWINFQKITLNWLMFLGRICLKCQIN
jgi:hypothetical protein